MLRAMSETFKSASIKLSKSVVSFKSMSKTINRPIENSKTVMSAVHVVNVRICSKQVLAANFIS
jgi:hypothetical protein